VSPLAVQIMHDMHFLELLFEFGWFTESKNAYINLTEGIQVQKHLCIVWYKCKVTAGLWGMHNIADKF